jgi:hypothetical protein
MPFDSKLSNRHAEDALRRADERAKAAIERAASRAETLVADAEAKAEALLAEHMRRLQPFAAGIDGLTAECRPTGLDDADPELPDQALIPAQLQEALAVRAYFKASDRGFAPGLETDDWLQAEQELVTARRIAASRPEA